MPRRRRYPGANTLPLRLSTFVGRTGELVRLGADLAGHRLVTLTGPGGVGKSRLAAEVAEPVADRYPDGVWWVEFAQLPAGAEILSAVLGALGLSDAASRGEWDHLPAFLRDRRVLLVLDNCEHVLPACAELVSNLLRRCPELAVLATSREPLGIAGELAREVPPLGLPVPGRQTGRESEATRLFLDRARAVRPDLSVTPATAAHVAEICRRLEGMPLAIELAAGRARVLTIHQIRAGLAEGLGLSAAGPRTSAGRHRTLEACIRWSNDLLSDAERGFLRRLSVFPGAFGVEAAAAVCAAADLPVGEVLDLLDALVGKSLVRVERDDGEHARYRLLEAIREFAAARLVEAGEEGALRDRHLSWSLAAADRIERALAGANAQVVHRLAADLEDYQAALAHALTRPEADAALRLAAPVGFLLVHRGRYREARDVQTRALARPGGTACARARSWWALGFASWGLSDEVGLEAAVRECLRLSGECADVGVRGRAHLLSAWLRYADAATAIPHLTEALRCAEEAGDTWVVIGVPSDRGLLALFADDHAGALVWFARAASLARAHGNDFQLAWTQFGVAAGRLRAGELAQALAAATESGRLARGVGDRVCAAYADYVLAQVNLAAGRPDDAVRAADRGLRACEEAGTEQARQGLLALRAQAGLALGEPEAESALAAAVALAERDGSRWEHVPAAFALARHLAARGNSSAAVAQVDSAERSGERFGGPWAAAGVSLLRSMLQAEVDPAAAAGRLHQVLATAVAGDMPLVAVDALEALARVTAVRGRHPDAARLLAVAARRRRELGYRRGPAEDVHHEGTLALLEAAPDPAAVAAARAAAADLSVEAAVSLAARARGPRGRPATGWAGLTPTEREVADLAAEGLSNAAIGRHLFISPGTVKTHLGHIYGKLGVANRTELAAAAGRRE